MIFWMSMTMSTSGGWRGAINGQSVKISSRAADFVERRKLFPSQTDVGQRMVAETHQLAARTVLPAKNAKAVRQCAQGRKH